MRDGLMVLFTEYELGQLYVLAVRAVPMCPPSSSRTELSFFMPTFEVEAIL